MIAFEPSMTARRDHDLSSGSGLERASGFRAEFGTNENASRQTRVIGPRSDGGRYGEGHANEVRN